MGFKRIHVRVPLRGEATLTNNNITIKARTIDVSQGGVAITAFSTKIPSDEYKIDIVTEDGNQLGFIARLVRLDDSVAGFQTLEIDKNSLGVINNLVFEYETTIDFINQLDEFNLLDNTLLDEEGNEIEITFEKDTDENI